ncbi:MAG: thioredoxin family protein [Candidatus Eisenbacteria bacterium]|nr:thioredoxin family protein [Candidatus Eisenbacteria bacterium]
MTKREAWNARLFECPAFRGAGLRGRFPGALPALLALLLAAWAVAPGWAQAAPASAPAGEAPASGLDPLRAGELALVDYRASIGDGILVASSRDPGPAGPRSSWFHRPGTFGPQLAIAGSPAAFPGLGEALTGMSPGERKRVVVPPDLAFGMPDTSLLRDLPRSRRVPRVLKLSPEEFVGRFSAFPVQGDRLPFDPLLEATVSSVTRTQAVLDIHPRGPRQVENALGMTRIETTPAEIVVRMDPRLGAVWQGPEGQRGIITRVEDESFRVDLNHRLAGKPITLDIEVLERVSSDSLKAETYPWREDLDAALAEASRAGRPVFLLLYASWCGWTHKLLDETMEEPQVKIFRDRFLWVKVASDLNEGIRERYGQTSSPMIVLLNAAGEVSMSVEGFQEAGPLVGAMRACLVDW